MLLALVGAVLLFEPSDTLEEHVAHATTPNTTFHYYFSSTGTLHESGSMIESSSPYFWLNSGGKLVIEGGVGKTVQGLLPDLDPWRLLYAVNNPLDTASGYFPQNLFRLVTKSTWDNVEQTVRFKITKLNMTETPNRDGWSGILLFSRYQDGDNLYYSGIRMDGTAVIKKKYQGTYYTLTSIPVFDADGSYHRDTNPNLIPGNVWMGLRSVTQTDQETGAVTIELWLDREDSGDWEKVLSATDRVGTQGAGVITGPAHAGIRTDYLDVWFDDYQLREL